MSACGDKKDATAVRIYQGICDGSAAVRLGRNKLLVAYDELNSLYVFDPAGSKIEQTISLTDVLQLSDDQELDLEAAVVQDDGIWWIGSHGRDSNADFALNRHALFKTSVPAHDGMSLKSGPFDLGNIIADVVDQSALQLAPKKGGVNVEGMSVTTTGDLLIALRSPLSDGLEGYATILQIAMHDDSFELVDTHQLALADRGIRDIVISDDGYLLIAGEVKSGGTFTIYRWQLGGELAEVLTVPDNFNAEALVDMGSYWLLLSDDGKIKRADSEAADGTRICDNIVRKNSFGHAHKEVYFRGLQLDLH